MTTLAKILAGIESIPETDENFRELRDAIRGLKLLIEQEKK